MTLPSNQQPPVPPATPTPGQETPPAAPAPGYITQEQFQSALDAKVKELQQDFEKKIAKSYQGTQSLRDQVNNRVTQMEAQFKNYGVQITPEMSRQMQNDALLETLNTPGTPGQEPTGEPEREPTPEEQAIYNAGVAIAESLDINIEDTDPEADIIAKASQGTEKEYLKAWTAAATTKKARLATNPPTQPGTPPANPDKTAARLPVLGGGGAPTSNPIANIKDPDELYRLAKAEGKF